MGTTTSTPDIGVDEVVSFNGFVTRASGPPNIILSYVVQTFAWVESKCTEWCAPRGIMCNLHTEFHFNNCAHLSTRCRGAWGSLCVSVLGGLHQHVQCLHHVIYVCSAVRCTWALSATSLLPSPKNIGVQFDPSQFDDNIERFSRAMAISSRFAVVPKFCGILSARNEVCCAPTRMAPRTPSQRLLLRCCWFCRFASAQVHIVERCFFHSG